MLLTAEQVASLNRPLGGLLNPDIQLGDRLRNLDSDGSINGLMPPPGTTYRVKPATGSDLNSGTSWATAFATLGKAITVVVAGDTILVSGTVAEATRTLAANNVTIRGVDPCVGSNIAGQGTVWMEAAPAQTELLIVSGIGCEIENICLRGPSAAGVTDYTKGVCIRLSGANGLTLRGCRFQGRAGSLAAIYSGVCNSDNVSVLGCDFQDFNTATYGAAILGVQAGGLGYSNWIIAGNNVSSCVIGVQLCLKCSLVRGNTIVEYGVPAAGGAVAAVLASGIDLRSTAGGGGGANQVVGNYLDGAYTATLYHVNADVAGSDNWIGNYAIAGTGVTYGVTFANPA